MNIQLENIVMIYIRNLTLLEQKGKIAQAETIDKILMDMQYLVSKGLRLHQPKRLEETHDALSQMQQATKCIRERDTHTPRRFARELHMIEMLVAMTQTDPLFRLRDILDQKALLDLLREIGSKEQCFMKELFQLRDEKAVRVELARLIELKLAVKIWIRSRPAIELTFDGRELRESLQSCANRSKLPSILRLLPSK